MFCEAPYLEFTNTLYGFLGEWKLNGNGMEMVVVIVVIIVVVIVMNGTENENAKKKFTRFPIYQN